MRATAQAMPVDPDAIHTETAMQILQNMIPDILDEAGPAVRARFDNAILNIAVTRILEVEGPARTATILMRLAEAVAHQPVPEPGAPVDLTQLDA
ncbi:MAG: hypothetical protein AAF529_16285 [Pseudomonadota bacterium]